MIERRKMLTLRLLVLVLSLLLGACSQGGDNPEQARPSAEDSGGSGLATQGKGLYEETCGVCHGLDLKGTDAGPPFLSPIYAPNHHPDESFYAAVEQGVQPHHWDFGPMPPQPAMKREQVEAIIAYVRSQQEEAGITEDPSHQ